MLRILGQANRLCDGVTRRDLMQVGALSLFGGMTTSQNSCMLPIRPPRVARRFREVPPSRSFCSICWGDPARWTCST